MLAWCSRPLGFAPSCPWAVAFLGFHQEARVLPGLFLLRTVDISAAFLITGFLIKNKNMSNVGITSLGFSSVQAYYTPEILGPLVVFQYLQIYTNFFWSSFFCCLVKRTVLKQGNLLLKVEIWKCSSRKKEPVPLRNWLT